MKKEIIDKYKEATFKVYKEEGLLCLSDNNYNWNGINVLECPYNPNYNEEKFVHMINLQDILKCSEDLKYFTGQLFLYHDFINNPLSEIISPSEDEAISTYFQNYYDRRYSMFITCCFEKTYNFWDRIGDRIASFFPDLLRIHQVDFIRIIDKIESTQNINTESFNWLLDFKNNEYQTMNRYRKDMVHYYQYEANYRFQHAMNCTDFDRLNELWQEKSEFPEFFKRHLQLAIEGYCKMFEFLKDQMEQYPSLYKRH